MKKGILLYFILATMPSSLLFSQSLLSADKIWDDDANPDYEWTNANNWNDDALPATNDDVFINNDFEANIASGDNITVESVALGADAAYTGGEPVDPGTVVNNTSGHLTIESGATLTTEKGGHEGSDGFHIEGVNGNESTLIVNGTLTILSDASGDGLDMKEYTSVVVGTTGILNVKARTKSGINTSDDITNSGIINITATSSCTDGIKFSGTVDGSKVINNSSASITIDGGGFMNYGINLNGDFTFDNFGTLTISGTTNNILEGDMTFNNYGTLAGNGVVDPKTFNADGSTISPGTSAIPIGKLTFDDPVNLSDIDLDIQINGAESNDTIEAGLIGGINITDATLNLSGTYTPVMGDEFVIIRNLSGNPITGTFIGLSEGATFTYKGVDLTISYVGGNGDEVTLLFPIPLPVELIDFSARTMESEVKLAWVTATETNNDFFSLERSLDGRTFEKIASITGSGNTNEISKYFYIDENPENGLNYYRLKQTDFDGQFSYSEIESVEFRDNKTIKIYPTLVDDIITVETDADADTELNLVVRDLAGRVFNSFDMQEKGNKMEISLSGLLPGNYFITIYNDQNIETFKFIKL